MARPKEVLWVWHYTIKALFTYPFNRHVNTQDFIIDKLKMCGWTTAQSLYILRHNLSKCEYVQVLFTMKNKRPNPSVSDYWERWTTGSKALWELRSQGRRGNTLSIWRAPWRSWIQLHKLIWTVSQVSPVNKKPVHYCLQDQAPQDNGLLKANKKPTTEKGAKKKTQI